MAKYYANERGVLILVALLKEHGIKRVIASPGTTNLSFVASLQSDSFFEMYSCVDERSAAYMACGLAAETGEPVVITCTGATASRNYVSALTEAYYRKLPILAVTGTQNEDRIGHLNSQLIDRSVLQRDIAKLSVHIPPVLNDGIAHECELKINKAITELIRDGGGPVHINLYTDYIRDFSIKELPAVKIVERKGYDTIDSMPDMPNGRIGIFLGSHNTFTEVQTKALDKFCASRDAVVFCDHTSGYYGKYKANMSLVASQTYYDSELLKWDLCIHVGEISAEYGCLSKGHKAHEVWRVNPDGEIRDQFGKLRYVFEMEEEDFFNYYTIENEPEHTDYINACLKEYSEVVSAIPELPFSNIWVASVLSKELPKGSRLHLGILNSTRSWNFFQLDKSIKSFANVGGFGIDGCVSSMIGASLASSNSLYFGVFGDLAFFYDMNSLGNRHIGNNIRLLIVNNGKGVEFRNFYHPGALFGYEADKYIAAGGHFGNKSSILVKNYAEALGYYYMSASNKEDFLLNYKAFVNPEIINQPIIFEVFTNNEDESNALKAMWEIKKSAEGVANVRKALIEKKIRQIVGRRGIEFFKTIVGNR